MDKEQVIKAISNATGGSFIGDFGMVTCIGWSQEYDEEGRPLYPDPNYHSSTIRIAGEDYTIIKQGWTAYILKPGVRESYTAVWRDDFKDILLAEVDLTPDYLK